MDWQFWKKPLPQKLSDVVRKALFDQFTLNGREVDDMRVVGKMGQFSGRKTEYIRIFEPALIEAGQGGSPRYDDLSGISGKWKALRFEGRIEKINDSQKVFLTELRPR